MATTRMRDRVFAALGAILFLGSACAVTAYYITTSNGSNTASTPQTNTCDIQTPVDATALPKPEAYKPDGQVTSLQTTDLTPGTGAAAKNGDCLVMKYFGNLASDGTVFDENYDKAQALQFTLGQGEVIQGWDQGLVGMKVGGTRRLVIPAALGYGSSGNGAVPANADLVFTVQLLKIK